jgi:hypothetical protein
MNLLVDGHNLIGQIPGLRLDDPEDEAKLVMLLRRFATEKAGRSVEIVFDRGVYGHPGNLNGYGVRCTFARSPQDADAHIIRRLETLRGKSGWTVVTADRRIIEKAAACKVRVLDARTFAKQLVPPTCTVPPASEKPERPLTPAEVEEWLKIFAANQKDEG